MSFMPDNFFIEIESCRIFVQRIGNKTKPALIFIHGASISSEFWNEQFADKNLAENFCLYAFDLPGHGKSQKVIHPEKDYTLKGLGKKTVEIINALSLNEYIIVTLSLSGNVIGECVEDLKGCKGIFLTGSSLLGKDFPVPSLIIEHPYLHLLTSESAQDIEVENYATHVMFQPDENRTRMFVENWKNTDPAFRKRLGKVLAENDYSDEVENLKNSKIPLALVYGKEEASVKPLYLKDAGFDLWENKIHLIENAGHLPNIDNAEEFNRLLFSFATKCFR
jgi:pimeloyl-ACP methyl ester carboxylesterase